MTLTFYAPSCGGINGGSHFANGVRVSPAHNMKVVACGPKYPFGTQFEIEGVGTVTCMDRGGMVGNTKLDLLVQTGEGCKADLKLGYQQIGKQRIRVKRYVQ